MHLGMLLSASLVTLTAFAAAWKRTTSRGQKLFLTFGMAGIYMLCGFGTVYESCPSEYLPYYCAFVTVLAFSFVASARMTERRAARFCAFFAREIAGLTQQKPFVLTILSCYSLLALAPLLYPTVRLEMIWHPPRLDISFFDGLDRDRSAFDFFVQYGSQLLFPFYLTSLYALRRRIAILAFCIIVPNYLGFVATGYIPRGMILIWVLVYVTLIALDNPQYRKAILVVGIPGIPFLLYLFFVMGHLRQDSMLQVTMTAPVEAIADLLAGQTNFPTMSGYVLDSGATADLRRYFIWLATTPIPKAVTGPLADTRINYEISYLINGLEPGDRYYTVLLTGVVTESIYIFGSSLFWLHAVFIGVWFGFLAALTGSVRCLHVVHIYFAVHWGYVLNRAGIASAWPALINSFVSLYLLILLLYLLRMFSGSARAKSGTRAKLVGDFELGQSRTARGAAPILPPLARAACRSHLPCKGERGARSKGPVR